MDEEPKKPEQRSDEKPLPLDEHAKAMAGILGTPKEEVDQEDGRDRKRRQAGKDDSQNLK